MKLIGHTNSSITIELDSKDLHIIDELKTLLLLNYATDSENKELVNLFDEIESFKTRLNQ